MANGGFEIPVDIKPQVQDSGNTQKFFTDLANQGQAAINKVARAAGQPITQEIVFEAKDGKLQASIRNTSSLLKKMERAAEAARRKEQVEINKASKADAAFRKQQIRDIERARKAEFKRIAEVERRAKAARKAELAEIQKAVAEGQKYLEKERQINMEISKRKTLRAAGMTAQKGSLNAAQQELSLQKDRLNNMTYMSDQWKQQSALVKTLEGNVAKLGGAGKHASASIVSGFIKAQVAMAAVVAVMNTLRDVIGDTVQRGKDIQALGVSFKAFGLSVEDAASSLEFTKNVAMTYGAELTGLDKTMRRITPTIVTMGGSLNDSKLLTEALAKRTAMLGLNTEQTGRYLEAFAQVMGKGKLQSEELNQQFSELDGALRGQVAQYLAANHGITNLNKAMENGEVKAGMFAEAFLYASDTMQGLNQVDLSNLQGQLEQGEVTLQQVINAIGAIKTDNLEVLGQKFAGVTNAVMDLWLTLNQVFADPMVQNMLGAIAQVLQVVIDHFNTLMKVALIAWKALTEAVVNAYETMKQIPIIGDMIKGLGDAIEFSAKKAGTFESEVDKMFDSMYKLPEPTEQATGSLNKLDKAMTDTIPTAGSYKQMLKSAGDELLALAKNAKESDEAQAAYRAGIDEFNYAIQDQVEAYKDIKAEIREKINLDQISKEAGEAEIEQIDEKIKQLNRESDAIKRNAAEQAKGTEATKAAGKAAKDTAAAVKTAADAYTSWTQSVSDSFPKTKLAIDQANNLAAAIKKTSSGVSALGKDFGSTSNQSELLEGALEDQLTELKDLQKNYARMVAMGYQLSASQKQVMKDLNETTKAIEKQTAANQKRNASMRESVTMQTFNLDGSKPSGGGKTVRWDMMSLSEVQAELADRRQMRRDKAYEAQLKREAAESKARREAYQSEMDAAYDSFVQREESLTATRVNGIQQVMQLTEQQERQRRQMFETQYGVSNPFRPGPQREHGGAVSGGSTYTVNERGREGFMTASGRMSEIKVPAWGQWKAPSSGEVIPAHVWSEMKAAGSAVSSSGSSLASSGASSVVSHVRQHGDVDNSRVTNHVTIQSASPVQAASEVMVAAAKRRRRRFR